MLRRQALLASSCSQLEAMVVAPSQPFSCTPEFYVSPPTPSHQGALPPSSTPPTLSSPAVGSQRRALLRERDVEGSARDSKACMQLVRSHSEPGLGSSTDTGTPSVTKPPPPQNPTKDIYLNISVCQPSPVCCSVVECGSGGSKVSMDTGKTFPHGRKPIPTHLTSYCVLNGKPTTFYF